MNPNSQNGRCKTGCPGIVQCAGGFAIDPKAPRGYTAIRVTFRAKGAPEQLARLRELAAFSPVFNTLVSGVPVDVKVEAK